MVILSLLNRRLYSDEISTLHSNLIIDPDRSTLRLSTGYPVEALNNLEPFERSLGFNPHLHVLISNGCFHENGMLSVAPERLKNVLMDFAP